MIRYCPACWAENAYEAGQCTVCGAPLVDSGKDFVARLIDAVGHPEPTRAALACEILGRRLREPRAVDALLVRLARQPDSMDVTAAAAEALGVIGNRRAVPALAEVLLDATRPLPARLAAAQALGVLGDAAAWQTLADAQALPRLPALLRQTIDNLHDDPAREEKS